jgi:hypothetical protein
MGHTHACTQNVWILRFKGSSKRFGTCDRVLPLFAISLQCVIDFLRLFHTTGHLSFVLSFLLVLVSLLVCARVGRGGRVCTSGVGGKGEIALPAAELWCNHLLLRSVEEGRDAKVCGPSSGPRCMCKEWREPRP